MKKYLKLNKNASTLVDQDTYDKYGHLTWFLSDTGYAMASTYNPETKKVGKIRLHRLVMDNPKSKMIDHINGDKLDNRKANLRVCTNADNMRNRPKTKTNHSGYKGVIFHYNKWKATIKVNYKQIYLGRFTKKEDAAKAYNEAALEHFGQFAYLNKI